jgi:hypothetical protein
MGAIENARRELWDWHRFDSFKDKKDLDRILAPLAAELEAMDAECARRGEVMTRWSVELEAAREAVECVELVGELPRPCNIIITDIAFHILTCGLDYENAYHGDTLLAALRAADAAKTEQEKRDV